LPIIATWRGAEGMSLLCMSFISVLLVEHLPACGSQLADIYSTVIHL